VDAALGSFPQSGSRMRKLLAVLLSALTALVAGILWWRRESERRALPCPSQPSWLLENPFMDAVAGTAAILDRIGLQPAERVLEIGSGPGRIAVPAAQRAGPEGSVTAVDVQPEMLARLAVDHRSAPRPPLPATRPGSPPHPSGWLRAGAALVEPAGLYPELRQTRLASHPRRASSARSPMYQWPTS
jgi:SAM-dependent methyltransferase